jgi:hypothetical protein
MDGWKEQEEIEISPPLEQPSSYEMERMQCSLGKHFSLVMKRFCYYYLDILFPPSPIGVSRLTTIKTR